MGSGISSCQTSSSVQVRHSLKSLNDPDARGTRSRKTTLFGHRRVDISPQKGTSINQIGTGSTNTQYYRSNRHNNNINDNKNDKNNDVEHIDGKKSNRTCLRSHSLNSLNSSSASSINFQANIVTSNTHVTTITPKPWKNNNNSNSNNSSSYGWSTETCLSDSCDSGIMEEKKKRCQYMSRSTRDQFLTSNQQDNGDHQNEDDSNFDPTKSFEYFRSATLSQSEISAELMRSTDSFSGISNNNDTNETPPGSRTDTYHGFDTRYNRPTSKAGSLRPNRRSAPNMLQLAIDEAEEDDEMARQARPPRPKSAYVRKRRTANREEDNANTMSVEKDSDDDFWSAESSSDEDFYSDILSIPDETTGQTPRGEANVKLGPKFTKITTCNGVNQTDDLWTGLTPLDEDEALTGICSVRTPRTFRSLLDQDDFGRNNLGKKASERSLSSVILLSPCEDPFDATAASVASPDAVISPVPAYPYSARSLLEINTDNHSNQHDNNKGNNTQCNQENTSNIISSNTTATSIPNTSIDKRPPNSNRNTSQTHTDINITSSPNTNVNTCDIDKIENKTNNTSIVNTYINNNENNYQITTTAPVTQKINENSKTNINDNYSAIETTERNKTYAGNLNENISNNNIIDIYHSTTNNDNTHNHTIDDNDNDTSPCLSKQTSPECSEDSNTLSDNNTQPHKTNVIPLFGCSLHAFLTNTSGCGDCMHFNPSTISSTTTTTTTTTTTLPTCCCPENVRVLQENMFTLVLALTQKADVSLVDFQNIAVTSRPQFIQVLSTLTGSNQTKRDNNNIQRPTIKNVDVLESNLAQLLYSTKESVSPGDVNALVVRHLSALHDNVVGSTDAGHNGVKGTLTDVGWEQTDEGHDTDTDSDEELTDVVHRESLAIDTNETHRQSGDGMAESKKVVAGLPPTKSAHSPERGGSMKNKSERPKTAAHTMSNRKEMSRTAVERPNSDHNSVISNIGHTVVESKKSPKSKKRPDSGIVVSSSASYSSSSEATREAEVDVTSQTEWIAKSLEMLQEVFMVRTEDHDSIKGLVKAITHNCDSDQLKAHAIYRWLSSQSLAYYSKPNGSKASIPTSRMKQLADGKTSYANIYQEMSRSAGLRCEKIEGYAKGDNYLPGSPIRSPANQHSWNAVAFNGHYALIDAKFGSLPYKFFVEHYFMTPPDEFRLSHYPKDKKWLLMSRAFSMEDFDTTLKTWPTMVAFNIRPLNMRSVLRTFDGRLSITVLLRSVAVTPQLKYDGPGPEMDSESLTLLIDQEIRSVDNAETFHVTLPQDGIYYFTLLVHDIEEDEDIPVFQYRIEYKDELL